MLERVTRVISRERQARPFVVAVAIATLIGPSGCYVYEPTRYDQSPIEIKVEGTPGIPFSGTISEIRYQVSQSGVTPVSSTKTLEGTVPATYYVRYREDLRAISCVMQKGHDAGELKVTLSHFRWATASGKTDAPFGVAATTFSLE